MKKGMREKNSFLCNRGMLAFYLYKRRYHGTGLGVLAEHSSMIDAGLVEFYGVRPGVLVEHALTRGAGSVELYGIGPGVLAVHASTRRAGRWCTPRRVYLLEGHDRFVGDGDTTFQGRYQGS